MSVRVAIKYRVGKVKYELLLYSEYSVHAVSYTHLDVYKRQLSLCVCVCVLWII